MVETGRATHVLAAKQPATSNNDKLRRAMQNSARIYWVWDHIDEHEALFEAICRPKRKIVNVAGRNSIEPETWLAQGSSPGLLVDTGAVRPLVGSAFARSHVKHMEQNGFKVVWRDLPEPQYMRGVGAGVARHAHSTLAW